MMTRDPRHSSGWRALAAEAANAAWETVKNILWLIARLLS